MTREDLNKQLDEADLREGLVKAQILTAPSKEELAIEIENFYNVIEEREPKRVITAVHLSINSLTWVAIAMHKPIAKL